MDHYIAIINPLEPLILMINCLNDDPKKRPNIAILMIQKEPQTIIKVSQNEKLLLKISSLILVPFGQLLCILLCMYSACKLK